MLHCTTNRRAYIPIMSKQLSIAAAASIFAMSAVALLGPKMVEADGRDGAPASHFSVSTTQAPDLPTFVPLFD